MYAFAGIPLTDLACPRVRQSAAEEELAEALKRCGRVQAAADEAVHQRDRLQAALSGAEGALRVAEDERAALAAERERGKARAQELASVQEETRR